MPGADPAVASVVLIARTRILAWILLVVFVDVACADGLATHVKVPTRSASPASLPGDLTMPRGTGPFPAVIILHGCRGIGPGGPGRLLEYAAWYADRGYAALILDSFASRGVTNVCAGGAPN